MRLNCSTDYAIRVLIYLAKEASVVSSAKLSGEVFLSNAQRMKSACTILLQPWRAGLLTRFRKNIKGARTSSRWMKYINIWTMR